MSRRASQHLRHANWTDNSLQSTSLKWKILRQVNIEVDHFWTDIFSNQIFCTIRERSILKWFQAWDSRHINRNHAPLSSVARIRRRRLRSVYCARFYQLQMIMLHCVQNVHAFCSSISPIFLAHLLTVFAQHSCRLPSCLLLSFADQLSLTMDLRFFLCHLILCSVNMAPSTTCYKITLWVPYTSTLAVDRMCWRSVCVLYGCICCPFNKFSRWRPATLCEAPHKTDPVCEIRAQMQFFGKKAEPPPPAGGQGGLEPRKGFTVVTWLPSGVQSYAKPGTQFVQVLHVHWPCFTFSHMRSNLQTWCTHSHIQILTRTSTFFCRAPPRQFQVCSLKSWIFRWCTNIYQLQVKYDSIWSQQCNVSAGQRLGDAAQAAGLNVPYGCREGVCGTCEAFLKQPNGMKNDVRVCSCVWAFECMHIVHTNKHGLVLEIVREYI